MDRQFRFDLKTRTHNRKTFDKDTIESSIAGHDIKNFVLSLKFYLFMLAFILIIFACNFTFDIFEPRHIMVVV